MVLAKAMSSKFFTRRCTHLFILGWFSEKKDTNSKVLDDATEYSCLIIVDLVTR